QGQSRISSCPRRERSVTTQGHRSLPRVGPIYYGPGRPEPLRVISLDSTGTRHSEQRIEQPSPQLPGDGGGRISTISPIDLLGGRSWLPAEASDQNHPQRRDREISVCLAFFPGTSSKGLQDLAAVPGEAAREVQARFQ